MDNDQQTDEGNQGLAASGTPDKPAGTARSKRHRSGGRPKGSKGPGAIRGGLDAIRSVRSASKEHADARERAEALKKQVAADSAELAHRDKIEGDYPQIVERQRAEMAEASTLLAKAGEESQRLSGEVEGLTQRLDAMKAANEEQLRPYRELMNSTKGRSDDAAKSLSDVRRAVKAADQQVSDTAKRREQRIDASNRSVDNAQDRLRKVQAELTSLQADPSASPAAVSKMQSEVVAEQAHLDAAREEVKRVTAECQQLMDNAQTHLWTQKQSLETLERQAGEARKEADARREEYERLHNEATRREKELSDQIAARKGDLEAANKDAAAAQGRIDAAQEALDEANSIHATPEATAQLRGKIAQDKASLHLQQAEVDRLAAAERGLRSKTRGQRYGFVAIVVVACVVVLALVVVMLVLPNLH